MILCNTRTLHAPLTGVQRYTQELLDRMPEVRRVAPAAGRTTIGGHLWEQFQLPGLIGDALLWSPGNTGPLAVKHQVLSVMDLSPLDHPEWSHWKFSAWYRWLLPRLMKRVRLVLTISEFSRERILHYCPALADRVRVTPLAADPRFRPQTPEAIASVRTEFGVPHGRYFVAVGSLEPRKNLRRLLAAWAQALSELPPDVVLVLTGGLGKTDVFGKYRLDLPPRVHLTGRVPDVALPAIYSGAIASAYVSLYEGFGLPPLEAMSCGVPVLTSATTSIPEVVGQSALTVDPMDVDAIAAGLLRLAGDEALRRQLSAAGIARASEFSWSRCAESTYSYLASACSRD